MFVPRALRLKGVREAPRPKAAKASSADKSESSKDDALVEAMQGISTTSPTPQEGYIDPKALHRGPKFIVAPVTPEYLAQLVAGLELIFSDYAHQEQVRAEWLQQRYRTVHGEEACTDTLYQEATHAHTRPQSYISPPSLNIPTSPP
jgi:hypothetical protein